jgi:hypothetical protein
MKRLMQEKALIILLSKDGRVEKDGLFCVEDKVKIMGG